MTDGPYPGLGHGGGGLPGMVVVVVVVVEVVVVEVVLVVVVVEVEVDPGFVVVVTPDLPPCPPEAAPGSVVGVEQVVWLWGTARLTGDIGWLTR